jgi:hypothetical protein
MGSDIPTRAAPTPQSIRNIRIADIRGLNVLDREVMVSDVYGDTDLVTAASAEWSPGINVQGYDRIMLLVEVVVGGASTGDMTAFELGIQAGFTQRATADTQWFDRATSFAVTRGDSTTIAVSTPVTFDTSGIAPGTAVRFAFDVACIGHYMRFRPSATGAALANSRATIRGIRDLQ